MAEYAEPFADYTEPSTANDSHATAVKVPEALLNGTLVTAIAKLLIDLKGGDPFDGRSTDFGPCLYLGHRRSVG